MESLIGPRTRTSGEACSRQSAPKFVSRCLARGIRRRGTSCASRSCAPLRNQGRRSAARGLQCSGPPCARRWAAARRPAAGAGGPSSHHPAPTISQTCAGRRALVSKVRAGEGGGREKLDAQPSDSTASRRWRRRTTRRGGGSLGADGSTAAAGRFSQHRSLCAPPGVVPVAAAARATRASWSSTPEVSLRHAGRRRAPLRNGPGAQMCQRAENGSLKG